jgi:hypothetical protein
MPFLPVKHKIHEKTVHVSDLIGNHHKKIHGILITMCIAYLLVCIKLNCVKV